jgi:hypothetical protein
VEGLLDQMGAESEEMNHRTSHNHIRHSFKYLRQSMMCLADSNLEAMSYTTQGVSGWQTERTCRDFERLKSWADDWSRMHYTSGTISNYTLVTSAILSDLFVNVVLSFL